MDSNDPTSQQPGAIPPAPASAPQPQQPAAPPVWATPASAPTAPTGADSGQDPTVASAASGWGPAPVMPGPVTPVAPKAKRRRDPLSIILVIAAFVALGGVGFAFGRVTAPAAAATGGRGLGGAGNGTFEFPAGGFGGNGGGTGAGGFGRGGLGGAVAIRGTVTAITATEVTIQIAGGGTVNIPISGTTTYHNESAGSASDVKTGATILVQLGAGGAGGAGGANPSPGASGAPRTLGSAQDITIVAQ